jgi:hypothetical protein
LRERRGRQADGEKGSGKRMAECMRTAHRAPREYE